MIDLKNIPKYVINLSERKDRLEHITKEFNYVGWDFIRFDAVNTGSYEGCAESHMAVARLAKENNEEYILVTEDDIFFMPYFHEILNECLKDLNDVEWDLFHFAPSIHRPLNYTGGNLVSLTGPHPQ